MAVAMWRGDSCEGVMRRLPSAKAFVGVFIAEGAPRTHVLATAETVEATLSSHGDDVLHTFGSVPGKSVLMDGDLGCVKGNPFPAAGRSRISPNCLPNAPCRPLRSRRTLFSVQYVQRHLAACNGYLGRRRQHARYAHVVQCWTRGSDRTSRQAEVR